MNDASKPADMTKQSLFRTGFSLPPARSNLVKRKRLVDQINEGLAEGRGLTLISAPAGYGKSIAAAEWARHIQSSTEPKANVFWLSPEADYYVPDRFFSSLAEIFLHKSLDAGFNYADPFGKDLPEHLQNLLFDLINNITSVNCILIMDDYHRVKDPLIHNSVQFLLENRLSSLHIVLITREDPPLSLARMRAHAEMTEIRARDLAFNVDEAVSFMKTTMAIEINHHLIYDLAQHTEGWAVGLQLAALSLRQSSNIEAFIKDFKGSHRYLVDYLVDEVLQKQPEELKLFLSQTAILKEFNAELCSVVTGYKNSELLLNIIEKANLFLIPLDEQREWYRYHHLFADCLRRLLEPREKVRLYEIASQWSESKTFLNDAVEYALATANYEFAADAIERILKTPQSWSSGYVSMLEKWLNELPAICIECRPELQVMASRALFLAGKPVKSEQLLDQAEMVIAKQNEAGKKTEPLVKVQISIYRAAIYALKGRLKEALIMIEPAMKLLQNDNMHIKARGLDTLGLIHEQSGCFDKAAQLYVKAGDCANSASVTYLAVNAYCEAAMVKLKQGQLSKAEYLCREALKIAKDNTDSLPPAGLAWAILGNIARERNDLDRAELLITKGIELATKGGIIDDLKNIYYFLTQLHMARDDRSSLTNALNNVTRVLRSYQVERLERRSEAIKARVSIHLGNVETAANWAKGFEKRSLSNQFESMHDFEKLTLARIMLVQKRLTDAHLLITSIIAETIKGNRNGALLEALILHTILSHSRNIDSETENTLQQALTLAEPESYVRIFVDEGEVMQQILIQYINSKKNQASKNYCKILIDAFDSEKSSVRPLYEILSPQEVKILGLIASGYSNQAIADKLFISLGTAKWHAHNIYQKLGVNSRTKAVIKGRELNLL